MPDIVSRPDLPDEVPIGLVTTCGHCGCELQTKEGDKGIKDSISHAPPIEHMLIGKRYPRTEGIQVPCPNCQNLVFFETRYIGEGSLAEMRVLP